VRPERSDPDRATGRRIAILAGAGRLPLEIAREVQRTGSVPRIVAIQGIADADYSGYDVTPVALGQISRMLEALRRDGTQDMVIAGHVRRPDLMRLRIDLGFIMNLPTILGLMRGGDDNVMRRIAAFFERHGLRVRGTGEVAPGLLAREGVMTGDPRPEDLAAARLGQRTIAILAPYDMGQAVVVEDGRILGVEGVEGTDALLGRLPPGEGRRVFIKTAKPSQDLRLDLPTVGPDTLRAAVAAGVHLTAIEAGRTLVVERAQTCAIAETNGMVIAGLPATPAATAPPASLWGRVPAIDFAPIGALRADLGSRNDACVGMALLDDLATLTDCHAVLVARQHVLAVNVGEPMPSFLARTSGLGQWGDNRRRKRNHTLIVGGASEALDDQLPTLTDGPIAGIAFARPIAKPEARDRLIEQAERANLFLLERR
jgi:DUF1009 family protein